MAVEAKVLMSFLRKKIENKIIDGQSIYDGITAQQDKFSKLPVPLDILLGKNTDLQNAAVAAKTGDKTAAKVLETAEEEWIAAYKETAEFVSYNAAGNVTLMTACGFKTTKTERKRKTNTPDQLTDLKVAPGKGKGSLTASSAPQKGTKGYITVAATPDTKVTMNGDVLEIEFNGVKAYVKVSGKSAGEMIGLQSNQQLLVSMFTFNSVGSSALTASKEVTPQ